ncbi:MAG: flagellar hook-basal body complex protein FliE [Candidatus Schekmanbacteria bacterium]|nr:flagellar hook-basal body complex protein FliE [Candidatus Schekmanbacteria bacterium]
MVDLKIGSLPFKDLIQEKKLNNDVATTNGPSFSDTIKDFVKDVNQSQKEADQAVQNFASGGNISIHETMISLQKADVSFKLMLQIRNKVLSAYEEIMKMQL